MPDRANIHAGAARSAYILARGRHELFRTGPLMPEGPIAQSDGRSLYGALIYDRICRVINCRHRKSSTRRLRPPRTGASSSGGPGQFNDNMAVNSAGRICCASPGQGAVLIFPPEGGAHRRTEKGDFPMTNICFGRADGRWLSSRSAVPARSYASTGMFLVAPWHSVETCLRSYPSCRQVSRTRHCCFVRSFEEKS